MGRRSPDVLWSPVSAAAAKTEKNFWQVAVPVRYRGLRLARSSCSESRGHADDLL